MTTRPLTSLELRMLRDGYVTSRAAAAKLGLNYKSVLRKVRLGELHGMQIGRQWFVERASISAHYDGPARVALGLDDWSDVIQEKNGETYVVQPV